MLSIGPTPSSVLSNDIYHNFQTYFKKIMFTGNPVIFRTNAPILGQIVSSMGKIESMLGQFKLYRMNPVI